MIKRSLWRVPRAMTFGCATSLAVTLASPARAQDGAPPAWNGIEVFGGLARNSPSWGVLGEVPEMNFGMLALRFSRPVGESAPGATRSTEFTVDLIPLAMTSPPYRSLRGTGTYCAPRSLCVLRPLILSRDAFPDGSAHGFGFNPAGITTRFRTTSRVSPMVGAAVGGLWFNKHVPTSKSSQFNFTAMLEAGVRLGPPEVRGITVSYRFHHISNAGTAGENPGLASHLVSVGIHAPRGRGRRPGA